MLRVAGMSLQLAGRHVLEDVSLDVASGRILGLIGPNGAGKSSLLRCMHAALVPLRGAVLLGPEAVLERGPRWVAQHIGVVPQHFDSSFGCTVEEFVRLGRYCHVAALASPTAADDEAVASALRLTGAEPLVSRPIDELSGGEFRNVLLAQALAQEPDALLLDEPLQHLDLRHQLELMDILRNFVLTGERTIVAVFHDLRMAARCADDLLLLDRGRAVAAGTSAAVLTEKNIRDVYGIEVAVSRCAATGVPDVVPLRVAGPPVARSRHATALIRARKEHT